MADTHIFIRDAAGNEVPVDVRTTPDGDSRQVLLIGNGEQAGIINVATQETLQAILDALAAGLDVVNLPATQPVSGSVSVSNLPATQPVSGSVSVSNLPGTQPVSLTSGAPTTFADASTIVASTYRGITIKNTSTTANAEIAIRNSGATGLVLDTITLGPNESVRETYPSGRTAPSGTIYMQLVSGTVSGTVFSS